jgi:hypothetical protein
LSSTKGEDIHVKNILMNIKEFQALHVDTNGTAFLWLLYISQLQFVAFYFISHNLNIRGPLLLLVTTCISSPFFELKRRSSQIIGSDMYIRGLLFQWDSTIKNPTNRVVLVQSGTHHFIEN